MKFPFTFILIVSLAISCQKNSSDDNTKPTSISFKINGIYHQLNGELTYNPLPVTGCYSGYLAATQNQPSSLSIGYIENANQVLGITLWNASTSTGNYHLTYQSPDLRDFYIFYGGPYTMGNSSSNYIQINYTITNNRINGTFWGVISDFNSSEFNLTEGKIENVPFRSH